jgi:hypothetical protein
MVGIPLGGVVGKRGIGCSFELQPEVGKLVGRDAGGTTRGTLWGQIALCAAHPEPALEAAQADLEDADRVYARHARIERREDALT